MAKVWKELDLEASDIKGDFYDNIMREKPNFNHSACNSKVIYRRKNFIIISTGKGFVVHNKKYDFQDAHTHCNNFNYAKSIIDLSVRKKLPQKFNKHLIESLIRVNRDKIYLDKLKNTLIN